MTPQLEIFLCGVAICVCLTPIVRLYLKDVAAEKRREEERARRSKEIARKILADYDARQTAELKERLRNLESVVPYGRLQ